MRGRRRWLKFRLADPQRHLAGVRLSQHACLSDVDFTFEEHQAAWRLEPRRFEGWRLEYRLLLRHLDGTTEEICDPGNPKRVPGPFGERSVAERADYAPPAWLDTPPAAGTWRELVIDTRTLDAPVHASVWSPMTATDRVLVAHDGPEFARLAHLGQYSAAGLVPAHHLVLLAPSDRNEWYSANPAYADALAGDVLPRLAGEFGTALVGMGASLGALAMLHTQHRHPGAFGALFLQSGSFFQPRFDAQEAGFVRYQRIVRFVQHVSRPACPVALTCGRVEENLCNNRAMATTLGVPLAEVPDGHNMIAWRDALHPHLTGLLRTVWRGDA